MTNLKKTRLIQKMTQKELAEKSGVNLRTLQDYEQGRKDINKAEAMTVYKLSASLNCTVLDLLEFGKDFYVTLGDDLVEYCENDIKTLEKLFESTKHIPRDCIKKERPR